VAHLASVTESVGLSVDLSVGLSIHQSVVSTYVAVCHAMQSAAVAYNLLVYVNNGHTSIVPKQLAMPPATHNNSIALFQINIVPVLNFNNTLHIY